MKALNTKLCFALSTTFGLHCAWLIGCSIESSSPSSNNLTSTTTVTTIGPTTSSSYSTSATIESNIGNACTSDTDCGTNEFCFTSIDVVSLLGGAPAGGYCSRECEHNEDCPSGLCITEDGSIDSGPGICFLECTIGPPLDNLDDPLDESKCHGRPDTRCQTIVSGESLCIPTCGMDSQCEEGWYCDPRYSTCVQEKHIGTAQGEQCDASGTHDPCEGICVGFTSGETMCSSYCVLGGEKEDTFDCGGILSGLCAFRPADNGAGDYGYCSPACTTQGECQTPNFWCYDVGIHTNGFCFGSTDCPNGQADCDSGLTCTETIYGPYCIDLTWPLPDELSANGEGGSSGSTSSSTSSDTTQSSDGSGGSF